MTQSFVNRIGLTFIFSLAFFAAGNVYSQSVEPPAVKENPGIAPAEAHEAQRRILEAQIDDTKSRLERFRDARGAAQAKLDQRRISDISFSEVIGMLQTQRVQLVIDLAGLEARQAALDSGHRKPAAAGGSATLIQLLEKSVKIQESALQRAEELRSAGVVPGSGIEEAQYALLGAKVKLEEARINMRSEGAGQMPRELMETALELAEKKARLETVEGLLQQYVGSRETVDEIRQLEALHAAEAHRLDALTQQLETVKARIMFRLRAIKDN